MVNRDCVVCQLIKLESCPRLVSMSFYFSPLILMLFPFDPWIERQRLPTIFQLLFQICCQIEFLSFEHGNLHICRISLIQVAGNRGSKWSHLRLSSSHRTTSQICAVDTPAFSYGASMRNKVCVMVCAAMMID